MIESFDTQSQTSRREREIAKKVVGQWAGVEKTRCTRDGGIDAFGKMPNSEEVGWWFAGWVCEICADAASQAAYGD